MRRRIHANEVRRPANFLLQKHTQTQTHTHTLCSSRLCSIGHQRRRHHVFRRRSLHSLHMRLCLQVLAPPQSLQVCLRRLCWQMLAPLAVPAHQVLLQRLCSQMLVPAQSLQVHLQRLCWQMLSSPQSLQLLLVRFCPQVPPQSLQVLLTRLCLQMLAPPQSLHWAAAGTLASFTRQRTGRVEAAGTAGGHSRERAGGRQTRRSREHGSSIASLPGAGAAEACSFQSSNMDFLFFSIFVR